MTATLEADRSRRSVIPWIFVGAMLFVAAVNAVMVTVAVRSWTGLVVSKPYERGIAYNQVLAAQHRQDALGWKFATAVETAAQGAAWRIVLMAAGPDGAPLEGLQIGARLVRPIEILPEQTVEFREIGPGRYAAEVVPAKLGQWDLRVEAARARDRFQLVERLVLK